MMDSKSSAPTRRYSIFHVDSATVFAVGADADADGDAAKADHERCGKSEAQRFLVTILAAGTEFLPEQAA